MSNRTILAVALGCLALAASRSPSLGTLAPQNQCSGDCSPCLGPSDPFCYTDTIYDNTNKSNFCVLCESPTGQCRDARVGEQGKDQSCDVKTIGIVVISCTYTGNTCQGSVTP